LNLNLHTRIAQQMQPTSDGLDQANKQADIHSTARSTKFIHVLACACLFHLLSPLDKWRELLNLAAFLFCKFASHNYFSRSFLGPLDLSLCLLTH
jgi:hypothetical protein